MVEPGELQLTTLAQHLGLSVKTVYYYFLTRTALIDALTELGAQTIGLPNYEECATWQEVLTETARWSYSVGQADPGLQARHAEILGPGIESMHRTIHRLQDLGWNSQSALHAYVTVSSWASAIGKAARNTHAIGGLAKANIRKNIDGYASTATIKEISNMLSETTIDEIYERGLRTVLVGIAGTLL